MHSPDVQPTAQPAPGRRASPAYADTRAVITAGPPQFQHNTRPGDTSRSLPWMSQGPQVYAARMMPELSAMFGPCGKVRGR
jgi:hypothetical protein